MLDITKYRAILVDLDGTLADTSKVNYLAYEYAVTQFGYHIDYEYFKKNCNGKHYLEFLPSLTTDDRKTLEDIHQLKMNAYAGYLGEAKVNDELVGILQIARALTDKNENRRCKIGLVTTASRTNTMELLQKYGLTDLFDVILTQEDVEKKKPDPEGYIKAMCALKVSPEKTLIFEDSGAGVEAAKRSGADYMEIEFDNE